MSTSIPSNLTALISALKAEVSTLANTPQSITPLSKHPPFFQSNTILRIQLISQINALISQLNGEDISVSLDGKPNEKIQLKILILHLRIELIRIESKMHE